MRNIAYPIDLEHGVVELVHGAGGRATAALIERVFAAAFDNPALRRGDDGAVLVAPKGRLVMSTDAHVVSPLFFPGGDIGSLSVHGTINDVAMMGAIPLHLSASFILEEGLPLNTLARIVSSMAKAAADAGVPIVTGDTKVVQRGKGDGVFITTTAVGVLADGIELSGSQVRPGDAVLLSGPMGEHGAAIMAARDSMGLESALTSVTAALHSLVAAALSGAPNIRALRDPTRGGVAAALNEMAHQSGVGFLLQESALPVSETVRGMCELLGLDPLNLACEGRMLVCCPAEQVAQALTAMRGHPLGKEATQIGTATDDPSGFVRMQTLMGGFRMVDWLAGDPLPRIC